MANTPKVKASPKKGQEGYKPAGTGSVKTVNKGAINKVKNSSSKR